MSDPLGCSGGSLGSSGGPWGHPAGPSSCLAPARHGLAAKSSKTISFMVVLGEKGGGGTNSPAPAGPGFLGPPRGPF